MNFSVKEIMNIFNIKAFALLIACSWLVFSPEVNAQKDTAFWFAAPEIANSIGDDPVFLRFLTSF